jgi:hypothetical protein
MEKANKTHIESIKGNMALLQGARKALKNMDCSKSQTFTLPNGWFAPFIKNRLKMKTSPRNNRKAYKRVFFLGNRRAPREKIVIAKPIRVGMAPRKYSPPGNLPGS